VRRIRTGGQPANMRFYAGTLWVGSLVGKVAFRIDAATNRVTRIQTGHDAPSSFAAGPHGVWVTSRTDGLALRIDPATNAVIASVSVGAAPVEPAFAPDGALWVPNSTDNTVSRVDTATNSVTHTIPVGQRPLVLNEAFGYVWAPSYGGSDVWKLRP
jgi:virginiamycin B lyase